MSSASETSIHSQSNADHAEAGVVISGSSTKQSPVVHEPRQKREMTDCLPIDAATGVVEKAAPKAAPQPLGPDTSNLDVPNYLQEHSKRFCPGRMESVKAK